MSLFHTKRFTIYETDAIQKAIRHIEKNYQGKVTADQLSQEYLIPIKKLQKGVKYFSGKTIHTYLLSIRLEKAKEILLNTDEPIQNIPEKIGLINLSHFSKAFKKYVGKSPMEYRFSQDD